MESTYKTHPAGPAAMTGPFGRLPGVARQRSCSLGGMRLALWCVALLSAASTALAVPIEFTFFGPAGTVRINGGPNQGGFIRLVLRGDTADLVRGGGRSGSDLYRGLTGTLTASGQGVSISNAAVTSPVDVNIGFPTQPRNAQGNRYSVGIVTAGTQLIHTLSDAEFIRTLDSWDRVSPVGAWTGGADTFTVGGVGPTVTLANGDKVEIVNLDGQRPFSRATFQATLTSPIEFTFSGPAGSVAVDGGPNRDGVNVRLVLRGDTRNILRGAGVFGSDVYRGLTGTFTATGNGVNLSGVAVTSPVDVNIGFPEDAATANRNIAVGFTVEGNSMKTRVSGTAVPTWDRVSATCPFSGLSSGQPVTLTLANGNRVRINNFDSTAPFGRAAFQADMGSRATTCAVISAGAFGAVTTIAPGSWIEIYGKNLAPATTNWDSAFVDGRAPTTLAGVRVLINNTPAFLSFVSPTQINAQVPDGVVAGSAKLEVTTAAANTESWVLTTAARAPGLLSPPAFSVNGRQYVAALHADGAFVGPVNLIPGAAFRPARTGDRVLLYGTGFGATNPTAAAGQVVAGALRGLPNAAVTIGGQSANVEFAGLAPGLVGLYQFNIVVPPGVTRGDAALVVTVDGVRASQDLVLTVE